MNIVSYLILLTVLLVVLCVIGILAVTFRTCFPLWCCNKDTDDQASNIEQQPSGRRNLGFDVQEEIRSVRPRPFNNMEPLESPPSYEEAIQQELFRFQLPVASNHGPEAENNNNVEINNPSTNSSASSSTFPLASSSQSSPSTIPRSRISRPRSSTSSSSGSSSPPLSTINEEEEEWPVRVVIDCIGVQTARLMENCDTTLHLSNGNALDRNSKC